MKELADENHRLSPELSSLRVLVPFCSGIQPGVVESAVSPSDVVEVLRIVYKRFGLSQSIWIYVKKYSPT